MFRGDVQNDCPTCKCTTFEPICPLNCVSDNGSPLDITSDDTLRQLINKAENDQVYDLDALFPRKEDAKSPSINNDNEWAPVATTE